MEEPTEGAPPTDSQDPGAEPQEPQESQLPEAEAQKSPGLTPEQIVDKAFQKTASWLGRRDQDLLQNIGSMIDSRMQTVQAPASEPEPDSGEQIIENPDAWFQQKYNTIRGQEAEYQQQYESALIQHAAKIMDTDPLFRDVEFGKEVVSEVKRNYGRVNRNLPVPDAANLMVKEAIASVQRKKSTQKTNPMQNKQPAGTGLGSVNPPKSSSAKGGKGVDLSPRAKEMAEKWGYKEDDLKRVFGED